MPIKFSKHESNKYYTAKWESIIYDSELIPAYEHFYNLLENSSDWTPELPELVDIVEADLSFVSQKALKELAEWGEALHKGHGIPEKKTAILLLKNNSNVPALFYELWTTDSPELVKLFSNRKKAITWLTE